MLESYHGVFQFTYKFSLGLRQLDCRTVLALSTPVLPNLLQPLTGLLERFRSILKLFFFLNHLYKAVEKETIPVIELCI